MTHTMTHSASDAAPWTRADSEPVIGVPRNTRTSALPDRLEREARQAGLSFRPIDLASLSDEGGVVSDENGAVQVTHLSPYTPYGEDGSRALLQTLENSGVVPLNIAAAVEAADDKITTARMFDAAKVAQPRWSVLDPAQPYLPAGLSFPLVLKRPQGALGRWNRLARTPYQLEQAVSELIVEGPTLLLAQEAVVKALGRSLRVVVLDGRVLAATELAARDGEWRSNGALGSVGRDVHLPEEAEQLAARAAAAVGLRYAGVDLLASGGEHVALEVNAGSPFDGAERRTGRNIAAELLRALLAGPSST